MIQIKGDHEEPLEEEELTLKELALEEKELP